MYKHLVAYASYSISQGIDRVAVYQRIAILSLVYATNGLVWFHKSHEYYN